MKLLTCLILMVQGKEALGKSKKYCRTIEIKELKVALRALGTLLAENAVKVVLATDSDDKEMKAPSGTLLQTL